MRLTLHIGQAKAGSTSIQNSLHAARNDIHTYGCLYPEPLHIKERHHWLMPLMFEDPMKAPSVVHRMGFTVEAARRAAEREWENLRAQLAEESPDHLILSSEVLFFRASQEEVGRARKILPTLTDDIRILAYIRSPVSRYLSSVQQSLKSRNKLVQPRGTGIVGVLESYRSIFGKPVETRVFEKSRLLGQDVVEDFIDWASLPIPFEKLPKMQSNESVSAEAMAVMQEISPDDIPSNQEQLMLKRMRFKAVQQADRSVESPTKPALREEISNHIIQQCKELPLLRDRYGLEFADVDYGLTGHPPPTPLNVTRIEELCAYDKDRKDLVLQKACEGLTKAINKSRKMPAKRSWSKRIKKLLSR